MTIVVIMEVNIKEVLIWKWKGAKYIRNSRIYYIDNAYLWGLLMQLYNAVIITNHQAQRHKG